MINTLQRKKSISITNIDIMKNLIKTILLIIFASLFLCAAILLITGTGKGITLVVDLFILFATGSLMTLFLGLCLFEDLREN